MADGRAMIEAGFQPDASNQRAFRDALGCFATGITVITINAPDGPMGFTANSFSSLSLDPALILWSLAKSAIRYPHYAVAQNFAVHVLSETQADLIARFSRAGAGFSGLEFDLSAEGVPLLAGALARFECEQFATHEGGDHLIVVGRVLRVAYETGAPLVFSNGQIGRFATT